MQTQRSLDELITRHMWSYSEIYTKLSHKHADQNKLHKPFFYFLDIKNNCTILDIFSWVKQKIIVLNELLAERKKLILLLPLIIIIIILQMTLIFILHFLYNLFCYIR